MEDSQSHDSLEIRGKLVIEREKQNRKRTKERKIAWKTRAKENRNSGSRIELEEDAKNFDNSRRIVARLA